LVVVVIKKHRLWGLDLPLRKAYKNLKHKRTTTFSLFRSWKDVDVDVDIYPYLLTHLRVHQH
jgi:hypothetical protein